MKTKLKSYGSYLGIALVGIAIGALLQFAKAWTEPTIAPPNTSIGAPLNTGAIGQGKTGNLAANGFTTNTLLVNGDAAISGSGRILDMNGNTVNSVGLIKFADGSVQTTAPASTTCPCGTCYTTRFNGNGVALAGFNCDFGSMNMQNIELCTPKGWVKTGEGGPLVNNGCRASH